MKIRFTNLVLAAALPALTGCAAFRARTADVDVTETRHMSANYDYSDMRKITESLAGEIAASPFLSNKPEPPVMMIAGVENRTTRHVDTKNLTDRMRTLLIQSNRIRFVNEARREDLLPEQGFSRLYIGSVGCCLQPAPMYSRIPLPVYLILFQKSRRKKP